MNRSLIPDTERFLRSDGDVQHFGPHPILQKLGNGAFGEVFLVMALKPAPHIAALKTIKANDATAEARGAFKLEAGRWVSLGAHPNIVTAYDVLTPNDVIGVLCDYVAPDEHGRTTMQDWIEAGAVTDELLVRWSLDFCAGMAHAYAHGLTAHRDIKPDNLLIYRGSLCVADFGLATAVQLLARDAADHDLTPAGSRAFMPPEQFIPRFRCDQRSDMYAFGVTLYVAITGGRLPIRPADVNDHDAWVFAHARDLVQPLRHFLWPVIERCLRKRPEQRFGTIDELKEAVQAAAVRAGIRVEPRTAEASFSEWEWLRLEQQAHSLALLGYEQESMQLYERAFALHDEPALWQSKANALLALGRLEAALECVTTALEKNDAECASWYVFGDVLRRMEQHEDAVMAYERALTHLRVRMPDSMSGVAARQQAREQMRYEAEHIEANLRHALSLSLRALGDYTRAQAEIGRAIALQPKQMVFRRAKAELFLHIGQNSAVLWEIEAAEAYAPNDWQLCILRVQALLNLGQKDEALQAATRSATLAPQEPHHLYTYAQVLEAALPTDVHRVCAAFENALARAEPGSELFDAIVPHFQKYLTGIGETERARQLMFTAAARR